MILEVQENIKGNKVGIIEKIRSSDDSLFVYILERRQWEIHRRKTELGSREIHKRKQSWEVGKTIRNMGK